jgi:hypothetical protein
MFCLRENIFNLLVTQNHFNLALNQCISTHSLAQRDVNKL